MINVVGGTTISDSAQIGPGVILNSDINASAAIAYSKLALSDSIVNADINSAAAIVYSKLNLTDAIVNADINSAAAIVDTKLAQISTASKVSGAALTSLASVPAGAGVIPAANIAALSVLGTGTPNIVATNDTFTVNAGTDVITSTSAHNLVDGDKVTLTTTGTLPAGLSLATGLFVRDATSTTFKLCTLPYRAAIDITDTGTGTHTWTNAQGSINLTIAAKTNLMFKAFVDTPTASCDLSMTFNEGGVTEHGASFSSDGAGASANSTQDKLTQMAGAATTGDKHIIGHITNIASIRKFLAWHGQDSNAAAASGEIILGDGIWNNTTDQITKICLSISGVAGMGANSQLVVWSLD